MDTHTYTMYMHSVSPHFHGLWFQSLPLKNNLTAFSTCGFCKLSAPSSGGLSEPWAGGRGRLVTYMSHLGLRTTQPCSVCTLPAEGLCFPDTTRLPTIATVSEDLHDLEPDKIPAWRGEGETVAEEPLAFDSCGRRRGHLL